MSSSPTKNISLSPSRVQGSGGGGRVSPSPSFVTIYKPGSSLSTKFVDRDCSLSESSFTESCTNFNHESTTLQSNYLLLVNHCMLIICGLLRLSM